MTTKPVGSIGTDGRSGSSDIGGADGVGWTCFGIGGMNRSRTLLNLVVKESFLSIDRVGRSPGLGVFGGFGLESESSRLLLLVDLVLICLPESCGSGDTKILDGCM